MLSKSVPGFEQFSWLSVKHIYITKAAWLTVTKQSRIPLADVTPWLSFPITIQCHLFHDL